MGYRSDVYIAVAFANEKDMKEVMAVYAMNEHVQKHNLVEQWVIKADNILYFAETSTKWYDSYEDVQGIKHMLSLVDAFVHSDRELPITVHIDVSGLSSHTHWGRDRRYRTARNIWF